MKDSDLTAKGGSLPQMLSRSAGQNHAPPYNCYCFRVDPGWSKFRKIFFWWPLLLCDLHLDQCKQIEVEGESKSPACFFGAINNDLRKYRIQSLVIPGMITHKYIYIYTSCSRQIWRSEGWKAWKFYLPPKPEFSQETWHLASISPKGNVLFSGKQPDKSGISYDWDMCWGLNSHWFPVVGVINPIIGVCTFVTIPLKGGMTIPNI